MQVPLLYYTVVYMAKNMEKNFYDKKGPELI